MRQPWGAAGGRAPGLCPARGGAVLRLWVWSGWACAGCGVGCPCSAGAEGAPPFGCWRVHSDRHRPMLHSRPLGVRHRAGFLPRCQGGQGRREEVASQVKQGIAGQVGMRRKGLQGEVIGWQGRRGLKRGKARMKLGDNSLHEVQAYSLPEGVHQDGPGQPLTVTRHTANQAVQKG